MIDISQRSSAITRVANDAKDIWSLAACLETKLHIQSPPLPAFAPVSPSPRNVDPFGPGTEPISN